MAAKFSWDNKDTWPNDSLEYVFLARAIDALGQEVFGGQWTGKEISAKGGSMPLEFQAASVWASGQAREWSRALLLKYESATTVKEASGLDSEARDRFVKVTREITAHCAWGRLVAAARLETGSFGEIHRDRWNNPKAAWFAHCQMPAAEAFNQSWGGKDYLPIFIRRAELDILTAAPVAVQAEGSPPLADNAAKVQPRNTAQRGAIERAINELWGGKVPLGLNAQRRNEQIQTFAKGNKLAVPSGRTIARYLCDNSGH